MASDYLRKISVKLYFPFEPEGSIQEHMRIYLSEAGMFPAEDAGRVTFEISIDKRLIGGFIAESGNLRLDMSLRTKLNHLKITFNSSD